MRPSIFVLAQDGPALSQCLAQDYQLIFATAGYSAEAQIPALTPALILLDLAALPLGEAVNLVRQIRLQANPPPILLLYDAAQEGPKQEALAYGAQDFLLKPYAAQDLSWRVKNLIELNSGRHRYQALFDSMDQGFCLIDVLFDADNKPYDYRFIEVNAAFVNHTGLSQAVGKCVREFVPQHEQHWLDRYGRVAQTGRSIRFEDQAKSLGRWFDVYAFRLDHDENHHVAVLFNDVTERKRMDAATQESGQRLHLALTAGQLGDWSWDTASDMVTLSPRAAEILGLDGDSDVDWSRIRALLHEEDRALARGAVERAVAEHSDYQVTYRVRREHELIWVAVRGRAIYSSQGLVGMTGVVQDITQQRRTEEALRRSEGRLQAIFNQASVGMAVARLDGSFEQVNQRFAEILGYEQAELSQYTFRDITHSEDLPMTEHLIRRLSNAELNEYVMEKRYFRKQGDVVWSRTSVAILRDAQGQADRFIGIIEDITERKLAEEALRRSEAELRALADSIPQLAWMAEPDGHIFWYNRRWYEYTGTTPDEMLGWGWEKVHHPDHLQRMLPTWRRALVTGEPWEDTFPLRSAAGPYRWFLSRAFPIRGADGMITRWFGTNTDVDEEKRAQEVLKDERRILELLQETGSAIASQLDLEALVQTVTDAGTELSGAKFGAFFYNVADEQGESFVLFTLSGAPRSAFEHFGLPRNTLVFDPTFKNQGVVRSDDITQDSRYGQMAPHFGLPPGHPPVRSYLAVSVVSRSGEAIGGLFFGHPDAGVFTERAERLILGIAAQATIAIDNANLYEARKKAQAALARAHEELEQRVAERTAKLREAVAQMEEFSYTVSHDLRAPLRGMQAYSKALLDDCGAILATHPHAIEYLQRIGSNAARLDKMARDVLTVSRIAQGELHLEPVSLDKLVRELLEYYPAMQAPYARIEFGTLGSVLGHEPSLIQVMSNYLSNAIKFTVPGRTPEIRIWSEKRGDDRRIWIADKGVGIEPKYQHRLFRMFERIHPHLPTEGTGVGLAVVHKAAERMGGGVGVESDGQHGSQFWLQLRDA